MASALPILTYHSLDRSGSVVSIEPDLFVRQMEHLAVAGWRTVTFAAAVERLRAGGVFPDRHLVVTFDDGYRNVYTEAFPVLQRCGFTATVFLVTDYCGRDNAWPGHAPPMGRLPLITWHEATEMQRHGIELAAHTCTHPDLARLCPAEAEAEILRSKTDIEAHSGTAVATFAYPYGSFDDVTLEITRQHFQGACTTRMGRIRQGDEPYALDRIDVHYFRKPSLFTSLPEFAIDPYLAARQGLRDFRARWT